MKRFGPVLTFRPAMICLSAFFLMADEETWDRFRIPGDRIAGWTEDVDVGFESYNGNELYSAINGGAQPYLDQGLERTSIQILRGESSEMAHFMAMDFGSEDKAAAMFAAKDSENPDRSTRLEHDLGEDVFVEAFAVYHAVARIGPYFFEISLNNIPDSTEALAVLEELLEFYREAAAR